jgi:hypothetical protein
MSGLAYLGPDNRPRIQVSWTPSAGSSPKSIEFVIDTGSTRTCIDLSNAIGMRLVGAAAVRGVSAAPSQALIFGGGQMEFDAEDRTTRSPIPVKFTGDVLVTSQHLIGQDVFSSHKLALNMDYSTAPPRVRLTVVC